MKSNWDIVGLSCSPNEENTISNEELFYILSNQLIRGGRDCTISGSVISTDKISEKNIQI